MSEVLSKKRVAVYIDAENLKPAHASAILDRASRLGRLTLARCCGNAAAQSAWAEALAEHAVVPVLTPSVVNQKNATDFALTIDIVAQANRGRFDVLVLASSDGDFQLLALHLRELGISCHAVCEAKAKDFLRRTFETVHVLGQPEASSSFAGFREAALRLLKPNDSMSLSGLGSKLRAELGEHYPIGKLSKTLRQHPDHFRTDDRTVIRIK
jgi:NYN domain